jgi:hypothetical protein
MLGLSASLNSHHQQQEQEGKAQVHAVAPAVFLRFGQVAAARQAQQVDAERST